MNFIISFNFNIFFTIFSENFSILGKKYFFILKLILRLILRVIIKDYSEGH